MRYIHKKGREPEFKPLSRYSDFVCADCHRISYDEIFASSFPESATKIHAKGDLLITDDQFWCVRQNVVNLFRSESIDGINFSRIAETEWYVVNITIRVPVAGDVYRDVGGFCPRCGKSTEIIGCVLTENQFLGQLPKRSAFTTLQFREQSDRDLFVDQEVIDLMIGGNIKGGTATLIPSTQESEEISKAQRPGEKIATGVLF